MTLEVLVVPLVIAGVLYLLQAGGYMYISRPGMVLVFLGYALANVGFVWDMYQMAGK